MNQEREAELRAKYGDLLDEGDPFIRAVIGAFTLCVWNRWKPGTLEYERAQQLRKQREEMMAEMNQRVDQDELIDLY